ncbi:hypothetical protein [Spiroplasma endosymbiont of Tiphia femorata]|uniref:hypothetical protein n=1 Tax=Spiroplasma endosymbiont of Tiphia femorata TaxID=3066326 RepID=UPI0030CE5273
MNKEVIARNIKLHHLRYYKEMKIKDLLKKSQFHLVKDFIYILECIISNLEIEINEGE